jgi:hypothetical protein
MADDEKKLSKEGPEIPAKAPTAAKLPPLQTDVIVEAWFKEFFPNSPVSRDTEAWNLLLRAKDVLKQRLQGD